MCSMVWACDLRGAACCAAVTAAAVAVPAHADIDLELRPMEKTVRIGEDARIGLYAASDDETDQLFAAMEVIFAWDPGFLTFLQIDGTGGVTLQRSLVPFPDPTGLNEADPPADGDGLYIAWAPLGNPIPAPPEGVLITTFVFEAIAATDATPIDILEERLEKRTVVFDGEIPGLDVTGRLFGAVIEILAACPEDLDGSGAVDFADLLAILAAWGPCPSEGDCPEDLDESGAVDFADLLAVLTEWGPCA